MENDDIGSLVYGLHDIIKHGEYADKLVEKGAEALPVLYHHLSIGYTFGHEDISPKIVEVIGRIAEQQKNIILHAPGNKEVEQAIKVLEGIREKLNGHSDGGRVADRVSSMLAAFNGGSKTSPANDNHFIVRRKPGNVAETGAGMPGKHIRGSA
ncbi:Uncharacterised protein [uncultured archaeon]|nr:Uncharacterised protein [uncultured archaeon]